MLVQCSHLAGGSTRSVSRPSPARGRSKLRLHNRLTLTKRSEQKFRCQAAKSNVKVIIQKPDGDQLHIDKVFVTFGIRGFLPDKLLQSASLAF